MSRYKKLAALFLAVCVSVILVAGCGQNPGTGDTAAPSSEPEGTSADTGSKTDDVTIRFSWWGGEARHTATLNAIDTYKKVAPNVTIEPEYQSYDGYEAKLATQIAGGEAPDLIQIIQTRLVEFGMKNDIFVDFTKQDIVDYTMWDESFRNIYGQVNGKLVGLTTGVNSYNLMFNKNVTDRLGIEIPDSLTWDSFIELGKKVHEADPNTYLLSADKDSLNLIMRSYLRQLTGEYYVTDDYTVMEDESVFADAFSYIRRLYDENVIEPIDIGFPYWGKLEQNKKWINEEIACMYCAASSIVGIKQEGMNIYPVNLPQMENAKKSGIVTQPAQLFAVTKSDNQDETLKFLSWLYTTEEGALIVKDTRGVPPTQFQRDLLSGKDLLDPSISRAVSIALPVTDTPVPATSENSQIYEVCQGTVEKVCYDALTPEEAAAEIISGCNKVLVELKEQQQ